MTILLTGIYNIVNGIIIIVILLLIYFLLQSDSKFFEHSYTEKYSMERLVVKIKMRIKDKVLMNTYAFTSLHSIDYLAINLENTQSNKSIKIQVF